MLLSEILEENSVQSIHNKTKISIDVLNKIIAKDFTSFKKVQLFGFISILEREYGGRIDDLHDECEEYFAANIKEDIPFIAPDVVKKTSKPKWLIWLAAFGILALATYFFMQSRIQNDIPVYKEEINLTTLNNINHKIEANSTINTNTTKKDTNVTIPALTVDSNTSLDMDNNVTVSQQLKIIPKTKLWFGIMNLETKELKNSIISNAFDVDTTKQWLIATSKASFSLQTSQGLKEFADYKVHYFKVDNTGFEEITKEQFDALGGPKKW
ncbi:MAG: hypothetical protein JXQ77_01580 [Campylobacterales bacterium]|nr:hypothetical protein [Campylobacterales bacterium]